VATTQLNKLKDPASTMTDKLIIALQNPALYDHPVKSFSVIETHISWVLLTGSFAYKIKKRSISVL
jgi:aminoglycoside phosphotransferase family enzyme